MDRPAWIAKLSRSVTPLLAAIAAEWVESPPVWRRIWAALTFLMAAILVRSLWWTQPIRIVPIAAWLAILAGLAIACRQQVSPWLAGSRRRLPALVLATALPQVLLLAAVLPRLSAFGAGCALAIAGYSIVSLCLWDGVPVVEFVAESALVESHLNETPERMLSFEQDAEAETETDDRVTHWQRRIQAGPGEDSLEGGIRTLIAEGEKLSCVHIPFAPPFEKPPEFHCEALSDSDVRAKVAALYSYGVRIELRRSEDTAEEPVELHYTATVSPSALRQAS